MSAPLTSTLSVGACKRILRDEDSRGYPLILALCGLLGSLIFGAEGDDPADPLELWYALQEDFGLTVPDGNQNKINAMMLAMTSDAFYNDPLAFSAISNALYDGSLGDPVDGAIEPPTAVEALWAVTEVELAREDEDDLPDFSPSVERFWREILEEESAGEYGDALIIGEVNRMKVAMFKDLRKMGVSSYALKLLDKEYDETLEYATEDEEVS